MIQPTSWFVYILSCADGTLYTGTTTNISRRVLEHNSSVRGAKYTRTRRPVSLRYAAEFENRSAALQEEWRIKGLKKTEKNDLCHTVRLPKDLDFHNISNKKS